MRKDRVEHVCERCGKTFERPRSAVGKFCSMPCMYASRPKRSIYERLWEKIARTENQDECWLWTGAKLKTGYGSISVGYKKPTLKAHRVAFESVNGPIPAGAFILHKCDVPLCCNPGHLYVGDAMENMRDVIERGRRNDHKRFSDDIIACAIAARRGGLSGKDVASLFGMSEGYVSVLFNGKRRQG